MSKYARWTRNPVFFAVLGAVDLVVLVALLTPDKYLLDLDVYRVGARVWLDGGDLYARLPDLTFGYNLPFTYPPFAVVVLSPLAIPSLATASTAITLLSVAALVASTVLVARKLGVRGHHLPLLGGAALPIALWFEPVTSTLDFGQINALLLVLVVADCLGFTPARYRGALIGIAAAVKLTPAAFILFFLVSRDRRAIRNAALSFVTCTALGFLFAGADSVRYWADVLFDTDRIGGPNYAGNQSITGVLSRFDTPWQGLLWVGLSALVVGVAAIGMRRAFAAGHVCLALALNALAQLLCSPVSWSHHWVWAVPLVLVLAEIGLRTRTALPFALGAIGVVLFIEAPHWWFPRASDVELAWPLWQQLVGGSYVYFGLVVLGCAAAGLLTPHSRLSAGETFAVKESRVRARPRPH
ncbi:glycosyltransferase 87 family protein [Umezawaea endophytica]|uniref:Glycosyltransferase 87 family protein n=1 Tax=Umezawaea endophytica TaxID=1654476 RepID=A0A9X2VVP6_9PSEU|nr:glycosyltransferase 87 family protein [Umezawaea endophytica]MCS7482904.1 glycosyltransferase 87 family protein [Umezawaea endophytica]